MDDLISRQAAIDALDQIFDRCEEIEAHLPEGDPDRTGYKMYPDYMTVWKYLHQLPSAQPEPLTLRVNPELTKEEYDKLMQDIKNAPIVLLPSVQQDSKPGEWLHDLLQDAIDDGIITEAQASRLMDRIAEDNT